METFIQGGPKGETVFGSDGDDKILGSGGGDWLEGRGGVDYISAGYGSDRSMLQVYDRVLASGSVPTLVGLAVLAAGLYAFQCLLEILRARVLLRIGERFDRQFSGRVHDAIVLLPLSTRM